MSKKYIPQGSFLYCDKGVFPTPFLGLEYTEVYLTDVPIATDYDNKPLFNILPFGPCIAKGGQFCLPAPTSTWNDPSAPFCGLVAKPILDDSTLSCAAPGTIRIAPSFMAALLEMYDDPGELMDKFLEYMGAKAENSLHFGWGMLKGAWETVKFVYTLAVETSPLIQGYQALTDWEGFSDKWEGRYETGKDVVEFGIQLHELSKDPVKQAQLFAYLSDGDNWERAFEAVYNKVAYADHTEVAEVQGMIAFEILLEVLTSGFGAARHIDKIDDGIDGIRAVSNILDNLDNPAVVADKLEDLAPDEIIPPRVDDIPDGPAGQTIQTPIDPPGTFRDDNGRLRDSETGRYTTDPNTPTSGTSLRDEYMGGTPGKKSSQGKKVIEQGKKDGVVREDFDGNLEFKSPEDGKWYPIDQADMSHKVDAVSWWNETGRHHGARSPEVREFMLDWENYYLEHRTYNRSQGAQIGETYLPPIE